MTREEEIKLVASCHIAADIEDYKEFYEGFIKGAEWADKTMLDRVCKWLQDGGYFVNSNETIEDFRKAMEGGAE